MHVHSAVCLGLADLVFARDKTAIAKAVGGSFLLASHLRSNPVTRASKRNSPDQNSFAVHALFSVDGGRGVPADVVCVTKELEFYKLQEPYASSVINVQKKRRFPPRESYPAPANKLEPEASKPGTGKAPPPEATGNFKQSDTCKCDGCMAAPKYIKNMSKNGNPCLYKTDSSIFDLFRVLGHYSDKVEQDVLTAADLSMASFDCETIATDVPHAAQGNEDINFRPPDPVSTQKYPRTVQAIHELALIGYVDQAMVNNGEDPVIFTVDPQQPDKIVHDFVETLRARRDVATTIKHGILSEYFTWLQGYQDAHFSFFAERGWLPIDYAFSKGYTVGGAELDMRLDAWADEAMHELCDVLDDDDDARSDTSSLCITDDDDDDDDDNAYETVTEEEEEEEEEPSKRPRLPGYTETPLPAYPADEKTAAEKEQQKRDKRRVQEITKAWEFSIFGLLQKRLNHLAQNFTVFAFNGEKFDNIILCSKLVTYCKQTGKRGVQIHREGSTIRQILFDQIRIAEIRRLAPGTDLSGLAKMCNLKEEKFIFPFSKLTTFDFLLEPKLPSDCSEWASSLNPDKSPTQDQVNEALAFYEERGFTQVIEFLRHYLLLDCVILQKSCQAIGRVYFDIMGLHFVDSRKFTASSFSATGAQTYLARNRRPGCYFVNHARIYAVIHQYSLLLSRAHTHTLSLTTAPQGRSSGWSDGGAEVCGWRGCRPQFLRGVAPPTTRDWRRRRGPRPRPAPDCGGVRPEPGRLHFTLQPSSGGARHLASSPKSHLYRREQPLCSSRFVVLHPAYILSCLVLSLLLSPRRLFLGAGAPLPPSCLRGAPS